MPRSRAGDGGPGTCSPSYSQRASTGMGCGGGCRRYRSGRTCWLRSCSDFTTASYLSKAFSWSWHGATIRTSQKTGEEKIPGLSQPGRSSFPRSRDRDGGFSYAEGTSCSPVFLFQVLLNSPASFCSQAEHWDCAQGLPSQRAVTG